MGKLQGKVALITGGNSGIGLATAKQFVKEGAYVYITGRRERELTAAVREIGGDVKGIQGDVSNLSDLDRLSAQIKREKGTLDIVFANAGAAKYAALGEITEDLYNQIFARPDVQAKEIRPWQENGEIWRHLAVTFSPSIANHNPDQVFYYDDKFMQRRMGYSPDVTGNPRIAHYTHGPKTFDGLVFPTRRLVHLRDEIGIANQKFATITVQVSSVEVVRG